MLLFLSCLSPLVCSHLRSLSSSRPFFVSPCFFVDFFFSSRRRHTRWSVTGVQTCALPILGGSAPAAVRSASRPPPHQQRRDTHHCPSIRRTASIPDRRAAGPPAGDSPYHSQSLADRKSVV